ncbi:hypothetical protein CHS0354_023896 [Potamilus streckersoni]|uniref:1-deoxy-D-xylulose-5-phosphate synthase n=1 Tax=Potamilus streckersoni TaxID=2493646 RepID=A0AAE0RZF7_9BIVA|nr:hypothetical protein CHS0354_023896 [Potamilus streckersoni]
MGINKEKFTKSEFYSSFGEVLSKINSPKDLRKFSVEDLPKIVRESREFLIDVVSKHGGHFAASLGVVELTIAIHYAYNTPDDLLVWDVGHQAYIHKILTGRKSIFYSNRQYGGISGFPKRDESEYDPFGVGHASTSISAALGMAKSISIKGENKKVIAVIGDGALTGGIAFEALNHLGHLKEDIVIILNDNCMSIDPNVGGLKDHLSELAAKIITDASYNRIRSGIWDGLTKFGRTGKTIQTFLSKVELGLKSAISPGGFFESLGIRYFGPVDGHDIKTLVTILRRMKMLKGPKILHILTLKGKGFALAEKDQLKWHAQSVAFDKITGEVLQKDLNLPTVTYQKVFGETILELAKKDPRILGITAAMPSGTSLNILEQHLPTQFFDVGIAEQHAVTFAAGLATQGMKPVVAIYSTFLQRAYDQVIHDVALQNLNVLFCLDRSGIVGNDGPTHHGAFDLSYLRLIPNMVIMSPCDENELKHMIYTAIQYNEGPIAIRYPRGSGLGVVIEDKFKLLPIGRSEVIRQGKDIALLSIGTTLKLANNIAQELYKENEIHSMVVNMRFVKPLDENILDEIAKQFKFVFTLEENTLIGGFGSAVNEYMSKKGTLCKVKSFGYPDKFIEHGTVNELNEEIDNKTFKKVRLNSGLPKTNSKSKGEYQENYMAQMNISELDEQSELRVYQQVWESLVLEKILESEKEKQKIIVSDQQVINKVYSDSPPPVIVQNFQDKEKGKIDYEKMQKAIENPQNKEIWKQVELSIKRDLEYEQLQSLVSEISHISDIDAFEEYKIENETVTGTYALFPLTLRADSIYKIQDSEINVYYKENIEEFRQKPYRKAKFVLFNNIPSAEDTLAIINDLRSIKDEFKGSTNDSDFVSIHSDISNQKFNEKLNIDEIKGLDIKNLDIGDVIGPYKEVDKIKLFKVKEISNIVKASHILLKVKGSAKSDSANTLQKANSLLKKAKSGVDFGKLAKENSEEPGAASTMGDLGWFGKGKMVKEFEEAALKGKKGQIIGPIKTIFGYHIIKITGSDSTEVMGVNIEKKILPGEETTNKNRLLISELKLRIEKSDFEKVTSNEQIEVKETGSFQQYGFIPILGYSRAVSNFAFSSNEKDVSNGIEVKDGFTIIQVSEVNDDPYKKIDNVKEQIIKNLIDKKKKEDLLQYAVEMMAKSKGDISKLQEAEPLIKVGRLENLEVKNFFHTELGNVGKILSEILKTENNFTTHVKECGNGVVIVKVEDKKLKNEIEYDLVKKGEIEKQYRNRKSETNRDWTESLKKRYIVNDNRPKLYK